MGTGGSRGWARLLLSPRYLSVPASSQEMQTISVVSTSFHRFLMISIKLQEARSMSVKVPLCMHPIYIETIR